MRVYELDLPEPPLTSDMSQQIEIGGQKDALASFAAYRFDTDEAFQQGLSSILRGGAVDASSSKSEQEAEMILRAKIFYFNKATGSNIDIDDVKHWVDKGANHQDSVQNDDTRVLTFAELKDLIESGKTDQIPNNKVIPDKLNTSEPSQSKTAFRKKPWETQAEAPHNPTSD